MLDLDRNLAKRSHHGWHIEIQPGAIVAERKTPNPGLNSQQVFPLRGASYLTRLQEVLAELERLDYESAQP